MTSQKPKPAQPWERQPNETEQAYRAFRAWLETDPPTNRSILESYRRVYGSNTAVKPPGYFTAWVTKHHWRSRAQQWDNDRARAAHEAELKAIAANAAKWAKRREAINEADFNDAEALRKKVQEIIAMPVVRRTLTQTETSEDGRTIINNYTIEPLAVRAADAARMLQLASDRQRLAADMATQIVETVTPESQTAIKLAEARRALEEGLQRFPELPPEQMAADLAALYSDDRKGIAIAPEDLLPPELEITSSDQIQ